MGSQPYTSTKEGGALLNVTFIYKRVPMSAVWAHALSVSIHRSPQQRWFAAT